jgi:ABC-type transport system substrate-binding protein
MQQMPKRTIAGLLALVLIVPVLAACGGTPAAQEPIRETVVVVQTAAPVVETVVVQETVQVEVTTEAGEQPVAGGEEWTTPHPILGTPEVRQAIAYCTNRPELIASVYPFLNEEQQQGLLMDTNLPQGHWALASEGLTTYPFDAARGAELLDAAGWTLAEGATERTNEAGEALSLSLTTTNAQFRQTWTQVFIQQMAACGIQIIPTYAPGSWWFGATTGLQRRDFELGAFAWVGETDPGGQTLYACNQIPLPSNNWEGQNYMGWCNDTASNAILAANNTLDREERIAQFAIFQQAFTEDMVSLPVFNRLEAAGAGTNVEGFNPNPTEYYTHNLNEWTLADGDTIVLGMTQEPASMFALVESAAVQRTAAYLIGNAGGQGWAHTQLDYDYQAKALTQLPTVENGGATNEDVEVAEGDTVWSAEGEAVELADGVNVINAAGEAVTYASGDALTLKQLAVTFEYNEGILWSDGEPLKQADFELAYAINCDPESGATSLTVCNSIAGVEFTSDTSYTITYHPGVQWAEYSVFYMGAYPSHLVLADGRNLADVPAAEWATLPEIAETPLSLGPYVLESWEKGQRMTFTANPNYYGGAPAIQTVIIQFIADTNQAVAQLLTGEVDVLGTETLGAGAEVQTVLDAAAQGQVQAYTVDSPTWEHIDMNLFIK